MELYPSILVDTYQEFEKRIRLIENVASFLHIDVGDGKLVPHKSFQDIEKMRTFGYSKPFELHLMLDCPELVIGPWLRIPAKRMVVHYEAVHQRPEALAEVMKMVKDEGKEFGVALNPDTPAKVVNDFAPELTSIIIMGVRPGFSGQKFIPEVLSKVRFLREQGFKGIIEMDGGMNEATLKEAKDAGADAAAVASAIFSSEDPPGIFQKLQEV